MRKDVTVRKIHIRKRSVRAAFLPVPITIELDVSVHRSNIPAVFFPSRLGTDDENNWENSLPDRQALSGSAFFDNFDEYTPEHAEESDNGFCQTVRGN